MPNESDDIRADIEAATAELTNPETSVEQVGSEPPAEAGATEAVSSPSASVPNDTRVRNPDGTFAPKAKDAAPVKSDKTVEAPKDGAPVETKSPSTDATTKASEQAAPTPPDAPPVGWTADAKTEWSKLSPAVKAAVVKRENEISAGGKQWSDEKRRYETALSPIAQAASRRGMDVNQGLAALSRAQDYLDRDPQNAIRQLAQNYGVNLATLVSQPQQAQTGENQQPNIQDMIRSIVIPMLNPIQQRFASEDMQKQTSVENLVSDFASSPGHEHFNSVESELMAMIPAIKNSNPFWSHEQVLQNAYDRAVWANSTTRSALQEADRLKGDETRRTEAAQRAQKARLASSSVTGRPSGTPVSDAPADSLRDEIMRAMAG